ncbi:hypothetical protein B9Z65_7961 [Elsinoe australis]|uniref:Rhodopsin domain-containing protein n=1 Tax=Elsinoe australis TaxID=40998 RepID=A0A2P7YVN6_9PEZI|nr:hypothetical protein B9Z65_7961 [Elsinoe australis]
MTGAAGDVPHFLGEMWGLYGAGTLIFVVRFIVRLRTSGVQGLGWDDLFALFAWVFYTGDAITVDRAYIYGTNVDFTPAQYGVMSSEEIDRISLGSKYELTAWYTYSALIWCMKASMLFFYCRLTFGSLQEKLVRWLAVTLLLTYITVVITISAGCRPYHLNWQVWPQPDTLKCTFRIQNIYVVSIFNIVTDVAILSIPVPLLWRLQVPKKQKIVVALFLMTGVVVIIAAVIRITVTLGSNPSTTTINAWGVRETIIGIICVNIPVLRPLFGRRFWSSNPDSKGLSAPSAPPRKVATQVEINQGSQEYILSDIDKNGVRVDVEFRMDNQAMGKDVEMGNSARVHP